MTKGRAYLERLFKRFGGRCHWCGCGTILPPIGQHPKRTAEHDAWATRDHLHDRYSETRRERPKFPQERRIVLACLKCNGDRGSKATAALPIEELRRRSMRGWKRGNGRQMQAEVQA